MAITQAEIDFKCKVTETIALGLDQVTDKEYIRQAATAASTMTLTPTSQQPGSQTYDDTISLTAGAYSLDLTALANGNLANKTFLGLKVQLIKIYNRSTNTATLIVVDGVTNGYNVWGDASGSVTIPIGGMVMFYGHDALDDVASGDKTIDFSSSDLDLTFDIQIVAG